MAKNKSSNVSMRVLHRYLGFFLAGIMAIYSISGIILIFRSTDFLKKEVPVEKMLKPGLNAEDLGKELKMREFKVEKTEGNMMTFKDGSYNTATGEAKFVTKELPTLINKMTKIHKATTKDPFFYLNIFFGLSLLFFVISTFWMFRPETKIFKKGLYFTLGGVLLTLFLLLF